MKNSIKLIALFLLAGTSLFAAVPVNAIRQPTSPRPDRITFASLPAKNGVEIKVRKAEAGKAIIIIYDSNGTELRKDVWAHSQILEKGYVLDQLEVGDYSVEVTVNKQVVKKSIHVYMEGQTKTFILNN